MNDPKPETMERAKEIAVLRALAYTNGNVQRAAFLLEVSRQTIHLTLKRMGLKP